jgi:hypothetical protein
MTHSWDDGKNAKNLIYTIVVQGPLQHMSTKVIN